MNWLIEMMIKILFT